MIVIGMLKAEVDVGSQLGFEGEDRIADLTGGYQHLQESGESLFDETVDEIFLVLEMQVQGSRRISDLFRQLANGEVLVSSPEKFLAGGTQDQFPELMPLFIPTSY
jgi:hypothetical protein